MMTADDRELFAASESIERPEQRVRGRVVTEENWMQFAQCRGIDPDFFFPERGVSTKDAKAVCAECPVKEHCLEYAIAGRERFGIWGGLSERERRRIRKQRQMVRRVASEGRWSESASTEEIDEE